jgi:hypothetical protein
MREQSGLIPGLPVLGEAFLAIYRPVPAGLERHFTFFLAVGTNSFVHFPRAPEASAAPESTVSHDHFPVRVLNPAPSIKSAYYKYVCNLFLKIKLSTP